MMQSAARELVVGRMPVVGVCRNPVRGMQPGDMVEVAPGRPIADFAPLETGLLVCRVNGEWLLRDAWRDEIRLGDVVEFYDVPEDKDILRTVLTIAVSVALGPAGLGLQGAGLFFATLAAQLAINALLPPTVPTQAAQPGATGESLSTSLQGNAARLDVPIPKICGRREVTPNFAGFPYFEFRAKAGAVDPDLDTDQYYFALFVVGIGDHDVIPKIGNTPITRFADVLRADYLAPGVQPTEVLANVQTAPEVSSQVLESGIYTGGFVACSPRRTCSAIGIDVSATRGLGSSVALTVTWRVEARLINDFGQVLGPWSVIANESRTAFTSTPQRWSKKYTVAPGRYEVRLVRTDVKDTSPNALHEIAWIALRAYLADPAPLNPHAAHFEVVLRASGQLSQSASQQVRLITQAKCRTWDPDTGWSAVVATRNPFWWALELLSSPTWGMSKPDARIDLESFHALALQADERQDRFDYVFDSAVDAWDALQTIARAGRARCFRRNGVISVARDELALAPVTAFTPRNCMPKILIEERHPTERSADGVVVEYEDHRTWEWTEIECPLPGVTVSEMTKPVRIRLDGVTGATHAHREGLYEAAVLAYRTKRATWSTEMQGVLPAYMSPVTLLPDVQGFGQSGDVVDFNVSELVATLQEPPDFSRAPLYVTLIRNDGTLTDPIPVTPGPTSQDITLETAPDFDLVTNLGTRERTKYILGPLVGTADLVRVKSIADGGKTEEGAQLFELSGPVDDVRVHEADVALLPGPGDVQDPPGDPDDSGGGGPGEELIVVRVLDKWVQAAVFTPAGVRTTDIVATYRLRNDGICELIATSGSANAYGGAGSTLGVQSGEWSLFGALETSQAGLYEARMTLIAITTSQSVASESFSGTLDTWLPLDTTREWSLTSPYISDANDRRNDRTLFVEIREIASGIVQDSATIRLTTESIDLSGD